MKTISEPSPAPARAKTSTVPPAAKPSPGKTEVGNYFISNYPPFSCWSEEDIPDFLDALAHAPKEPGPLGLYVHLPFCRQRCHYCYFRVYPRRNMEDVEKYIQSVLRELSLYKSALALAGRPISSVYFGGGSPSYLGPEQIKQLLGGLQEQRSWKEVEECTFECEPGTVTLEKLRTLKQLGVTRLSLGFQSLNNDVLRRSGRDLTVHECTEAFEMAREAGFKEINIDLLAGLPGETSVTWARTIERILDLVPDCITIYQLELTYNSSLYHSMRSGRDPHLADWETKRKWVAEAFETLEHLGYTVGSGYMAIRDPSRWRFVYTVEHFWHGADLIALGETAFGHIQGVHYQNVDTFLGYNNLISHGRLPVRRAHKLSPEEKLRREVILQLKTGSLDAGYFRQKFGVELTEHFAPQLDLLRESKLLEIAGDDIRLTRAGLLQVDWLLPHFYLPEHVGVRYT
jgi:coproporphyrinogen III oxidase-like Fe-S oxidoreductase